VEQDGKRVMRAAVDKALSGMEVGAPDIPTLMEVFQLPAGAARVRVLEVEEESISIGELARIPEPVKLDYDGPQRFPSRPDIYRNAYWPGQWVKVDEVGMWRGHRLAALKVHPLRVNPARRQGIWVKRAVIRIEFVGSRPNPIDGRPLTRSEQEALQTMLGALGGTFFAREREPEPPVTPDFLFNVDQYKVYISQEGLYRITYQDLVEAGISVLSIDPRFLRLRNKGGDVPIYVAGETNGRFDPQDYIEFYGIPNRETYIDQYPDMYEDPWSDVNVYWLSWAETQTPQGLRLIEESCPIVVEPDPNQITPVHEPLNFPSTVHIESNGNFQRLSNVYETQADQYEMQDHWFIDNGIDGFESRSYLVELPYPDTIAVDSAHIRIALTGLTFPELGNPGTHHAQVWLNNYTSFPLDIGQDENGAWAWIGQEAIIADTRDEPSGGIPRRALVHGTNSITINCPGNTPAGANDTVLPNWFEITYPRMFRAHLNQLYFKAPASIPIVYEIHLSPEGYPIDTLYHFRIDNFATDDISVYKIGTSVITNFEVEWVEDPSAGINSYVVQFQDWVSQPVEYLALTQQNKLSPDSIQMCTTTGRLASAFGANYVVIAHPSFLENVLLQDLLEARSDTATGFTSMLVSTEEIYDEFNHGIVDPYALKDFLDYAYFHWLKPPEMVLLVGDLVYDMKDVTGFGGCWVPSIYANGYDSGWYPSDYAYSLISGGPYDMVPDISIGRIPCRTNSELNRAITKIMNYETTNSYGPWRNTFLFVSSEQSGPHNFVEATRQIMGMLPEYIMTQHIEEDSNRVFSGDKETLRSIFQQEENSNLVTIYNGHGAGGTWAGRLWLTPDIGTMFNRYNLPFVTNFTCYICAFDSKEDPSDPLWVELMGEEFLQHANDGAIGVYGSVSLGWLDNLVAYQQIILPMMAELGGLESGPRIGDIVSLSKGIFSGTSSGSGRLGITTLHQMVLLGDPGVRLLTAQREVAAELSEGRFMNGGDANTVTVQPPFTSGSGDFRLQTLYSTYHPSYPGGLAAYPTYYDSMVIDYLVIRPDTSYYTDTLMLFPWEQKHVVFSQPTVSVNFTFPDTGFGFMSWLGYPIANQASITGYLHNGVDDAVATAVFFREEAYDTVLQITDISTVPDTLMPSDSVRWGFRARVLFAGVINEVGVEYSVRDAQGQLVVHDSVGMEEAGDFYWERTNLLGPFPNSQECKLFGNSHWVLHMA
jgi:hypothetical protein